MAKWFVPAMMSIRLTRLHVASTMSRASSFWHLHGRQCVQATHSHVHVSELPAQSQQSRTRNSASQSHCATSDTPPRRRRRAVEGKRNTKVTTTQRTQQAGQERVINWTTRCGAKSRQDSKGSSWSCSNAFELRELCNSTKHTKGRGHVELNDAAKNSQLHMTLRTPVCLQLCSGCILAN